MLGIASIGLNVAGPRLLGHATDLIAASGGWRTSAGNNPTAAPGPLSTKHQTGLAHIVRTIESVLNNENRAAALAATLSVAAVAYGCSGLCWMAQGRLTARLIQRRMYDLRLEAQAKLVKVPLDYLDRRPRGDLLSRVTNDIDNVGQTLQQTISQITNSLLLAGAVLGMMFWMSPSLAALALSTIPPLIFMTAVLGRRAHRQFSRQWEMTGVLSACVEELYTQHTLVKSFGKAGEATEVVRRYSDSLVTHTQRAQFLSGVIQPLVTLAGNICYVIIAIVGGLRVASGALSIGEAQAFIQYSRQLGGPLTNAATLSSVIQSGVASAHRIFELIDAPEEPAEISRNMRIKAVGGRIDFESVAFGYEPDRPVIRGLSFCVTPGQTVAIVGPTGAGKTTLVNLLIRFYEVTDGSISLDGDDISGIPRPDLRAAIGIVPQDPWTFTGTIADNIAYGKPRATRQEIEHAARAAQVDHFIRTLPRGYETVIDHDETKISDGERQLITIARAFLANPPVLILDEATSSVDTRTEVLVQQAIARLSHGRTSLIIAHRLSTIRTADIIVVMNNGSILESGTHDDLLAANGHYARLYAAQFSQPSLGQSPL